MSQLEAAAFVSCLKDKDMCLLFWDFLCQNRSSENLIFWIEIENYRSIQGKQEMISKAREIQNDYLLPASSKEINIDDELVAAIKAKINNPDEKLFDAAQHWIFTLMWQDSWPKFVKTDAYKQAMEGDKECKPVKPKKLLGLFSMPGATKPVNKHVAATLKRTRSDSLIKLEAFLRRRPSQWDARVASILNPSRKVPSQIHQSC
eukprot:TRINITY_DN1713_c0_g1_i1.p1 TRINITY_DN1713_c0_g1~~TRINITY_DN1713_c0_g1_i1.p1  ORF type:complete len:204 (-),score=44.64 TRINITY_DN1713_c0_g1_i1:250-861(-)